MSIQEEAFRFILTALCVLGGGMWINMAIDYYKQQKYHRFGWCIMCIVVVVLGIVDTMLLYD